MVAKAKPQGRDSLTGDLDTPSSVLLDSFTRPLQTFMKSFQGSNFVS